MFLKRLEKDEKSHYYEYIIVLTKIDAEIHDGFLYSDYQKNLENLKLFHLWFADICDWNNENNKHYPAIMFSQNNDYFSSKRNSTIIYAKFKTKHLATKFMKEFKSRHVDLLLVKYITMVPKKIVFSYNLYSITITGLFNDKKFEHSVSYRPKTIMWYEDLKTNKIYDKMNGWLLIDRDKIYFSEKSDAALFKISVC